jgi:Ca2+-transporting ATPase
VVGDVILLETGARVPADVAIINENGLKVQDPLPRPSKVEDAARKAGTYVEPERVSYRITHRLVKAGSIITSGSAKAIVCVVGKDSTRGIVDRKLAVSADSPLNEKLDNLAKQMMLFALAAAAIIFIELMIFLFINIAAEDDTWSIILAGLPRRVNQAVVLAIVSFPEGLSLTFQLSMAFVVMQMYKKDKVLVRSLDAPELMGQVEEIIVGKTGTITKAEMKVKKFFIEGNSITNSRKNTLTEINLQPETLDMIKKSFLFNSQARIETDETSYIARGNATDVCFINFLQDADVPVHLMVQRKNFKNSFVCERGFRQGQRLYYTAVRQFNDPTMVDIFVKGAPEEVHGLCQMESEEAFANLERFYTENGNNGLRMISFAYYSCPYSDIQDNTGVEDGQQLQSDIFDQAFIETLVGQMTFLACFGLKDNLRDDV